MAQNTSRYLSQLDIPFGLDAAPSIFPSDADDNGSGLNFYTNEDVALVTSYGNARFLMDALVI